MYGAGVDLVNCIPGGTSSLSVQVIALHEHCVITQAAHPDVSFTFALQLHAFANVEPQDRKEGTLMEQKAEVEAAPLPSERGSSAGLRKLSWGLGLDGGCWMVCRWLSELGPNNARVYFVDGHLAVNASIWSLSLLEQVSNKNKSVPSFLKLRTTLAEGTAVGSVASRLYSSCMYSGGSLRAATGLVWGLSSVRFIVDRNWLRKSCASSSGLSPTSRPTDTLRWLSGDLMGLLKLQPVNIRSRTLRLRTNPRLEKTEMVMVEWRKGRQIQEIAIKYLKVALVPTGLGQSTPQVLFLHCMALYEHSGVLWAVGDDLMDGVQNRHHCFSVKILRWVLLPTRQITHKVAKSNSHSSHHFVHI
ncbi:hypothetical protein EYF80_008553 [Liparis tanakae]|uniref:Uncharacterized protein n=1 Tax=Liparis tanakae TaxID=230148 RepID=A0A4Z2IT86_9TELE|nr:hypothetical protein EYF80_008553 [Liparis tanakae]